MKIIDRRHHPRRCGRCHWRRPSPPPCPIAPFRLLSLPHPFYLHPIPNPAPSMGRECAHCSWPGEGGDHDVRTTGREDEPEHGRAREDAGVGAGGSGAAGVHREAGAGAEPGRGAGAHRCGRDLCHRSRGDRARAAGADPGRVAVQQELDAGPRIHGHGCGAGAGRRRVRDRRPGHGGDPRRLRPVQALPHGHVHVVPELRAQLRRGGQGPSRQRLHHRRRLCRVRGEQHQHADPHRRHHVGRGGDAGGDGRHGHVRADRAGRAGGGRERGGDRAGPHRAAGRRGGQSAGRVPGDPHGHARGATAEGARARRRPRGQRDEAGCGGGRAAAQSAARASTT